jgi:nucleoid DNA-binding protein
VDFINSEIEEGIDMNKQDVVNAVAQKTGLQPAVCEKIIDALEAQGPAALASEFLGSKTRQAEIVAGIAARTGASLEDCEQVVSALEDVVKAAITDKLGFLKGIFSKS